MVTIKHKSCRKLLVPFSQLTRIPRRIAKMSGEATVNGQVVAEAEMMCKLADRV